MSEYTLAVVGMETYQISVEGPINKLIFTDRNITIANFKKLFFNQNNVLCIEEDCLTQFEGSFDFDATTCSVYTSSTFISDTPSFDLYDFLLQCASADLNYLPITYTSKIELKKNVNGITHLSDLRILSGLRYSDVESLIVLGNKFVVTAVFTNPNCHVKNAALQFTYVIADTDDDTV
jgi:hypothetical protein